MRAPGAPGGEGLMEGLRAIANRDITKVTFVGLPDRPGIAAEIFGALGRRGINVEMVVSTGGQEGTADISLAIARDRASGAVETLEAIRREVGARALLRNTKAALIGLLGHGLQTEPGIAGRMFGALSRAGVNIEAISTSMSSVSCMIEEARCEAALAALRHEFNLD
jgi:aspartate kinase